MSKMKIAIIGAGNGGKAAAADLTLAGHKINLFEFPEFRENIRTVQENGGVHLTGVGCNGFAKLNKVTIDIEEAFEGVEMILLYFQRSVIKKQLKSAPLI